MSRIKAILFDLDGTLLDTLDDLATSMNIVLARLGLPVHPREHYRYFVGDGMEVLARRVLPEALRTPEMIRRCSEGMRDEYQGRWAVASRPYDGIGDLLPALSSRGLVLNILSNKPDGFTRLMVDHFLAAVTWRQVRGARPGVAQKPDPAGALAIAGELGLRPDQFLYLGDTNTDMMTATAAGMFPVGALWGFRTREELAQSGAKTLLSHPLDLLDAIDQGLGEN